jgi:hypothetical protein
MTFRGVYLIWGQTRFLALLLKQPYHYLLRITNFSELVPCLFRCLSRCELLKVGCPTSSLAPQAHNLVGQLKPCHSILHRIQPQNSPWTCAFSLLSFSQPMSGMNYVSVCMDHLMEAYALQHISHVCTENHIWHNISDIYWYYLHDKIYVNQDIKTISIMITDFILNMML